MTYEDLKNARDLLYSLDDSVSSKLYSIWCGYCMSTHTCDNPPCKYFVQAIDQLKDTK